MVEFRTSNSSLLKQQAWIQCTSQAVPSTFCKPSRGRLGLVTDYPGTQNNRCSQKRGALIAARWLKTNCVMSEWCCSVYLSFHKGNTG